MEGILTSMDKQQLTVATDIRASKKQVFDHITDYNKLGDYSDAVRVAVRGEGVGSRCYVNVKQKVLEIPAEYTARVRFTEYQEPDVIEWEMVNDLDLKGEITLESRQKKGCTLVLDFELNVDNSDFRGLPAPSQAGFTEIGKYLYPKLEGTMNDFIRDLVSDIEGHERDVEIRVENISDELSSFKN